jgi:hypothetical protein
MKEYFKYRCEEVLLQEEWGYSTWYFEVGEDSYPARQIELYDSGPSLRYDVNYSEDEYGGLGIDRIEGEFKNDFTSITCDEFEQIWNLKS